MEHILSEETFDCMKAHHRKWHELNPDMEE